MAAPGTEAGEFSLIITGHDAAMLAESAKDFAAAFHLDEEVAFQVVKTAPIIFIQKLTKTEVKAISPKLAELSKKGLEFRITARTVGKMPKLNWPVRPQFTAANSGAAVRPAFDWNNTAFVCPSCGDTFQFQRVGKLQLSESPATTSQPAIQAAPTPVARPKAPVKPAAPEPVEEPGLDIAQEPDEMEGLAPLEPLTEEENQPLPGEGETLELPDTVEEIRLDEIPTAEEPVIEAEIVEEPAEEPAVEEEPAAPAGADDGEQYNVFLSKIVDRTKQEKAVELIAKMKKITPEEARDLTTRLVIPIAKGIGKGAAEQILEQFKKHKIFGRMTKVK